MRPAFLVALILVAYARAADECYGANVITSPYRIYNSVIAKPFTSSSGPDISGWPDVWYKISNNVELSAFTFYSSSSIGFVLYNATTCDKVGTTTRIAAARAPVSVTPAMPNPMLLPRGNYYLRIGSTGGSSTTGTFEFAFTDPSDYTSIVNGTDTVQTALPISVKTDTYKATVKLVPFIYLTNDDDGRDATAPNVDWDSQWLRVTLPPMITRTVTFTLNDQTYPGVDDHTALKITLFNTSNQASPSGTTETSDGVKLKVEMTLLQTSTFFLRISRTTRATVLTNYNLTITVQEPVPGPELTTSIFTSAQLTTSELTTQGLTTSPLTTAGITTATWDGYGSPGYRWPKPSVPAGFCASRSWQPHRASNNNGYFCVDDHYYVQCQHDNPSKQSAVIGCAVDYVCRCASTVECSQEGKRSPCGPNKDQVNP